MSQFDESKIRRDAEGKFANKGPAAEAGGIDLSNGMGTGSEAPTSCCRNCGQSVTRDARGSWEDSSGGDGCGETVHAGVAVRQTNTYGLRSGDQIITENGVETISDKYENGVTGDIYLQTNEHDGEDAIVARGSQQWTVVDNKAQAQAELDNSYQRNIPGRPEPVTVTDVQPSSLQRGDIVVSPQGVPVVVTAAEADPETEGAYSVTVKDAEGSSGTEETSLETTYQKVITEGSVGAMQDRDPSFVKDAVLESPEAQSNHRAWEIRDADIEQAIEKHHDAIDKNMLNGIGDPDKADVSSRWAAQDVYESAKKIAGGRRGPMCGNHRWGHVPSCQTCTQPNGTPNKMPDEIDPAYWREKAGVERQSSYDSFQRSDTDGALTQWASDTTASKYLLQAEICENGGKWRYRALFTTDGKPVPAKLIDTRYGQSWAKLSSDDPHSKFSGEFVNPSNAKTAEKRDAAMAKKGYREGYVWAPARAELGGSGTGLGSLHTVHSYAHRTDGGYDPNAEFDGWDTEDRDW